MIKIGVAGCGGVGSNVAHILLRAGILNFVLVDFDKIDKSNLNRQFYFKNQLGKYKVFQLKKNLKKINCKADITAINLKLGAENIETVFKDCDIIIDGFDGKKEKVLLIDKFLDSRKFIVSANGIANRDLNSVIVKKFENRVYIVGDFTGDINRDKTYLIKVGYIASIMANIVLDIIGENFERCI